MEWTAAMIAPSVTGEPDRAPLFVREFALEEGHGPAQKATLRWTGLGVVEPTINGRAVSEDLLSPGWSSYQWRVRVVECDVEQLLEKTNVLGLLVGNGWYRGRLTWSGERALYGDVRAASATLKIVFSDGYVQTVSTDESWGVIESDIVADDLYDGETIDARLRKSTWYETGAAELAGSVQALAFDFARLVPSATPPIRRQETLRPRSISPRPGGKILLDFGQNIVGWLRITLRGDRGSRVVIKHAEVLENSGLATRPLRSALATDTYILTGATDVFEPRFTFHGFRYAEISGWPGVFDPNAVEAVVVHSDIARIGEFSCSDPLLNQLHQNVVWSLRGNAVGIPSDCPQRDERLGWTGDISVFAPTAAFLFDVQSFLTDWLADVGLEQVHNDNVVPSVVPDVIGNAPVPYSDEPLGLTAIWSDAAVWVPYALWMAYGEEKTVETAWGTIRRHMTKLSEVIAPSGVWDTGFQYGDWLDPQAPPDAPWDSKTDPSLVATASAYRTATFAAELATVIHRDLDADNYRALAARIRRGFNDRYVREGVIGTDSTTSYALAIAFGLLGEPAKRVAGDRLAQLVELGQYKVTTGFAGTPYICDALVETGHLAAAYGLLTERSLPSWLYPVTMGATTIWERWDSMLPDGSINPGEMTSFNHYAFGSIADWMHRTIGGLSPLSPGYKRVRVSPKPGGGLTSARASLISRYGSITVVWEMLRSRLMLVVEIPRGVVGEIELPDGSTYERGVGRWTFDCDLSPHESGAE